ncbi:FAD-dependent oxidoreductase [Streptomyces botrytidirepellens]|uniref:FAD-dependent monooxygenase n=1 Tax=Streptomyces botrytidirepellens TaxID=2486417 RepID=A0A3M8WL43_9ACTN|nr:NAD(P)/FAD-dependent oxidoreductase [Streptomyces botrytidirepellens]RNG30434.1 FAD-dependent monooxygenase [Streptomyces botrytidirepellens]
MSEKNPRYDAVVCGAGAGGLASARALGELGLRVLVVDKQPHMRPVAKGEVLQPGALRVLRRWGTERLLEQRAGVRLGRLVVRAPAGTPLMALDYGRLPEGDRWLLSHDHLAILDALAEGLGPTVEVRRGVLVEEALRDGSGRVTGVAVTEGGRRYEVHAPLTVAADGISSRLRRAAGIDARRVDYPHRLVSFDLAGAPRPDDFSAYLSARGLRLVYALPGDRVRLYVQTAPDELRGGRDRSALAAWAEGVVAEVPALEPLSGPLLAGLDSRQMLPVSRFLSPRLAVPGMAFVGEAAYAVHPMAAQGMNTAITCAASLADRLAEHLHGAAPTAATVDAALRAYQAERRPILAQAATTSDNAARMVTDLTWRGRVVGRRAVRFTGRNPRLLHTVTYNMSGLGPRPMTFLDRLHQLGVLPDPRAHRVPQT